jgi:hypothetical protein
MRIISLKENGHELLAQLEMSEMQDNNTTITALENLRKRLLDLTARNRLINFRQPVRS